ncbi:hypothetical protein G9P44_001357 [Scheffersomyces stipitis]|nr:hypothetical protein G9P44_001357 [Scheffersomyces stipitis]
MSTYTFTCTTLDMCPIVVSRYIARSSRLQMAMVMPAGPQEVILTGTFDDWSKSLYLVKQADGSFELTVPLPKTSEKLLYKYVVDGDWVVSKTQKISKDDSGNENNVLEAADLVAVSSLAGTKIPEAGGLVSKSVAPAAEGELKTTVLPSTEGQQTTLSGEPGIHIPKDADALAAFNEVRDVDPKTLNEPELSAEEKKKQKKKVKRTQYKLKKKKKNANGSSEEVTDEQSPEPEAESEGISASTAGIAAGAAAAVAGAAGIAGVAATSAEKEAPKTLDPKAEVPAVKDVEAEVPTVKDIEAEVPAVKDVEAAVPVDAVANGEAAVADVEKEVDASPVKAAAKDYEDEIVVATGEHKDIAAAIAAQEGDVTVEEIQPSASERIRLTEEAKKAQGAAESAAKAATTSAESPVKEAVKETTAAAKDTTAAAKTAASATAGAAKDKTQKKKNGLVRFFKKVFS